MTFHGVLYGVEEAIWVLLEAVVVVAIFSVGYLLGDTIPRISKQYLMLRILGIVAFATLFAFLASGTLGTRVEGENSVRVWYPTDTERTTAAVKSWLV